MLGPTAGERVLLEELLQLLDPSATPSTTVCTEGDPLDPDRKHREHRPEDEHAEQPQQKGSDLGVVDLLDAL